MFADADFETAVDNALTAAFTHSGQVCSAGCRAIVEDAIYDRFVAEIGRRADRIRLGHGTDEATEAGALITAEHRAKVEAYVATAIAEGARLVAGGRRPDEPELQAGFFYRPTVFADVRREMRIVREEVFGPVLTDRALHHRGRGDRAGQRHDLRPGRRRLDRRRRPRQRVAGAAPPRDGLDQRLQPYLPQAEWGGFKQSGIGRELGPTGLDEYREAKHIWENTAPAPTGWFGG